MIPFLAARGKPLSRSSWTGRDILVPWDFRFVWKLGSLRGVHNCSDDWSNGRYGEVAGGFGGTWRFLVARTSGIGINLGFTD